MSNDDRGYQRDYSYHDKIDWPAMMQAAIMGVINNDDPYMKRYKLDEVWALLLPEHREEVDSLYHKYFVELWDNARETLKPPPEPYQKVLTPKYQIDPFDYNIKLVLTEVRAGLMAVTEVLQDHGLFPTPYEGEDELAVPPGYEDVGPGMAREDEE